ncbi:MAG: pilus assembly protein PilP [Deltaproteobacteria bacterium]|nr:pilus assembly protein PilP [Deltaproteobacteria bacterium]
MSAVFGLLLGLVVHHGPTVATAQAEPSGPVVAIERAHNAAAAESRRAHESDAQAERIFSPNESAAPVPDGAKPDAVASGGPTDTAPNVAADAVRPPVSGGGAGKYDPNSHRDPFRPPNLTPAVADKLDPRTPLEGYEIGQLKLVGIVTEAGNIRAMVEDSAGLGYIVTTGTSIGSSGGVVRSIEQRRILIQEMTTNFYGEKQAKEVVMELPQEDRSP